MKIHLIQVTLEARLALIMQQVILIYVTYRRAKEQKPFARCSTALKYVRTKKGPNNHFCDTFLGMLKSSCKKSPCLEVSNMTSCTSIQIEEIHNTIASKIILAPAERD